MFRTRAALIFFTSARFASSSQNTTDAATELNTPDLKHHLKTRDVRLTVPSRDHLVSVCFVSTRSLLAETIARHDLLSRTGAYVPFLEMLGTQLSFTQLLASPLSGEERVEVRLTTDEATIHTSALGLGESFGYIRSPYNAQLLENGDIQDPFPLKVDRVLYNQHLPFSSMVSASLQELLQIDEDTKTEISERGGTTPPLSLALQSLLLPTDTVSADDVAWRRPSPDDVLQYFSSNSTLHAYNYYRRSDGTPSAVWLQSDLSPSVLADAGLLTSRGEPTTESTPATVPQSEADVTAMVARVAALKATLLSAIPASFGVQMTPLAAGPEVEWRMWTVQRALVAASAASRDPFAPTPLTLLLQDAQSGHTLCQTVLSLVTGDVEGAFMVAKANRQYTRDPAEMARCVEPVRAQLGLQDACVALDGEATSRTPLDFFCRCSKANILSSFASVPEATLKEMMAQNAFQCTTCGRWHVVTAQDWSSLTSARAGTTPPTA